MIDNIDQLVIRACKSKHPYQRLHSVYRRFYIKKQDPDQEIANLLAKICDRFTLVNSSELVNEMDPANNWKYDNDINYWQQVVHVLSSKIRLSEIVKFPGLIKPLIFRHQ